MLPEEHAMVKTKDSPAPTGVQSAHLWDRACAALPGGVSSPVRAFRSVGGTPVFVERAEGPYIFDADGKRYIDFVGSWGPAIVGHAHPKVIEAVRAAAGKGLSFGAPCRAEVELAEKVISAFPQSVEMVRFVSSGTEATMSAVRLARGATSRSRIIKFEGCYHGHADGFLVSAGSGAATFGSPTSPGVPEATARETLLARYNDLDAVASLFKSQGKEIAAIIVEPVAGNMGMVPPAPGFLEGLRQLCDQHGAILIFDEVMTGFRIAWGGYQNTIKVRPDLTCLGKVIGGGMPVAAYAGPRKIMEQLSPAGPIYQAGTLSGSPVGMAAGLATLNLCAAPGFYTHLGESTDRLVKGLKSAAQSAGRTISVTAEGGMFGFTFTTDPIRNFDDAKAGDHKAYARFFHAMLDRGVWLPPSSYEAMFLSSFHTQAHIDAVMAAARESFLEL
jgi:glutamate-1-semialdehyde 2,1-aminomutase